VVRATCLQLIHPFARSKAAVNTPHSKRFARFKSTSDHGSLSFEGMQPLQAQQTLSSGGARKATHRHEPLAELNCLIIGAFMGALSRPKTG
jgi:hypothetical protein